MKEININLNPLIDGFNSATGYFVNLSVEEAIIWILGIVYIIGFFTMRSIVKNDRQNQTNNPTPEPMIVMGFASSPVWVPFYIMYKLVTFGISNNVPIEVPKKMSYDETEEMEPLMEPAPEKICNKKDLGCDKPDPRKDSFDKLMEDADFIHHVGDQDMPTARKTRRYEYRYGNKFGKSTTWSEVLDIQAMRSADYVLDHVASKLVKNRYGKTDVASYYALLREEDKLKHDYRKYEYRFGNNTIESCWSDQPNPEWHKCSVLALHHDGNGNVEVLKCGDEKEFDRLKKQKEEMLQKLRLEQLQDLKLQVLAQNPSLLGASKKSDLDEKLKHLTPYIEQEFGTKEQRANNDGLDELRKEMIRDMDKKIIEDLRLAAEYANKNMAKDLKRNDDVCKNKCDDDDILADDEFLDELRKM